MTDSRYALQDALGSPASFGAFPGAPSRRSVTHIIRLETDVVRYTYRYEIEAYALRPRETLEIVEARDEDEQAEEARRLGDKYVGLNRSRPVVICSTPIRGSRREL